MNPGEIKYWRNSTEIKFVYVDNNQLPLTCIDIWCKAGSTFEEKGKNGSAHFLEHMIFKGSKKSTPGEFDHKIESLGGSSNAATGHDDVHYYVVVPPSNFEEALNLLIDLVFNAKISSEEFDKEKKVVLEEIKQQNDDPDDKLFNYFLKRIWKNNSYGNSILGNEENIISLKTKDLNNFYQNNYNSKTICIAIAGDLPKNILEIIEKIRIPKIYRKFTKNHKNKQSFKKRTGREEIILDNLQLSRIFMGWPIKNFNSQRIILGFEVLASILCEGKSSRFVSVIKEENNLVESIYLDVYAGEFGGLLVLEAVCKRRNIKKVENEVNKLINNLIETKDLSEKEINKALNIVKSNYYFNLETSSEITSFLGNQLLWGRENPLKELSLNLNYWSKKQNFNEVINNLSIDKYTLVVKNKYE